MPIVTINFLDKAVESSGELVCGIIQDVVLEVMNTQGGLKKEHVLIMKANTWRDESNAYVLSILIGTKRTPDYVEGQKEFVERIAEGIKKGLVSAGIIKEEMKVKVALTLQDTETAGF